MRRISTWADTQTTGTAIVDLGDGIRIPLPVDGDRRIAELEAAKWFRGDIGAGGEINSLRGTAARGRYTINATTVTGLPGPWLGSLEVLPNGTDGRTIQEFTRSIPGTTAKRTRVYSAGAWSEWTLSSWFADVLPTGVDWDTLKSPAVYGIQFTNHPNQAAPVIGTLEILPVSGNVIHRFTEGVSPFHVWRRRFNGTAWTKFERAENAGATPPAPTGPTIEGFAIPVRGELVASTATVTPKSGSQIMAAMSQDRTRGWNQNTASLSETRDDGATWTQINAKDGVNPFAGSMIESVVEMDNQELLITCQRGNTGLREVWVSSNMRNPASRTFTRTMVGRAPFIKFTGAWSISTHQSIVLINEYGPKTPEWQGAPIAVGDNARYTYLSLDSGLTWSTIFDLNDLLTYLLPGPTYENQHLHGVAWDEYWDRIWVTFGDAMGGLGSNGIVYSDDLGASWRVAHFYSGTTPPHQLVGIQPMPKCVLFYGDMGPDVVRIDRAEGKGKVGEYTTPVAFNSTAGGKHLCQGYMRVRRAGDDGPALASFGAEGATGPSFAIATMDGYKFTEIWRDSADNAAGYGARSIVGPTLRGKVIIGSNDQKVTGMWSEIQTAAPGY